MNVQLKYGSGSMTFQLPADSIGEVVRPRRPRSAADAREVLADSTATKLEAARPDCSGRSVLVLLADGTRDQPHVAGYGALAPLLRETAAVRVLLATGTHKPDTPDDLRLLRDIRQVSAELGIPLASAGAHDCRAANFYEAGVTSRGVNVRLNDLVRTSDTILIVSDTMPHYFAGYSNAIKFLLPGVAAFDCIEQDHAAALDPDAAACRHPLHTDPDRRRNPVAQDQLDAARLVTGTKPVYALVMASSSNRVGWATFGRLEDAVAEGIRYVDAHLVTTLDRRFRCAVISCGGYPNDETMYIAQRSLELTKEAVGDGGEILWLAECRNGIASSQAAIENFFIPLKGDIAAYTRQVQERYVMYAHKTVRLAQLMDRLGALFVVSKLPPGTFPAGRMVECDDPQSVVAGWARRGEQILFVDEANKQAIRV